MICAPSRPDIPAATALRMMFFFSSRRRHTRYWRDWSSDVCSSDLTTVQRAIQTLVERELVDLEPSGAYTIVRSEERRVGKECKSRWEADREKNKGWGLRRVDRPGNAKRSTGPPK